MQWRKKLGANQGARKDSRMDGNRCACVVNEDDDSWLLQEKIHIVLPGYEGDGARVIYSPAVTRDGQKVII